MKKGIINIHIIISSDICGKMFSERNHPGLIKAATFIKMQRTSNDLLLLNNGQTLTGSKAAAYFADHTSFRRNPQISIMNAMQYDASNISVSDFSLGRMYFNRSHSLSDFPFISVNVINSRTKEPYYNKPYIIKKIKGIKVAVIAISEVSDISHIIEDIEVENPIRAARTWIRYLYDVENPDFVIGLHNGDIHHIAKDGQLRTEGIDLIITNSDEVLTTSEREIIYTDHNEMLTQVELEFKERTNSFEYVKKIVAPVNIDLYPNDPGLVEKVYYDEKEYRKKHES
ncbi:hypothetical protein LAU42_03745 [Macrococcus armenti]|uniref:hypothetical protein n=1 Tax=Macrococcus armenti TaxID=2875764 RepID=UPI001CCD05AF|nr:hypothetical protein [Macrococcus armenti]UBH23061.1 hypothetical protein LAU42_03745 [Macrococcus armenti]